MPGILLLLVLTVAALCTQKNNATQACHRNTERTQSPAAGDGGLEQKQEVQNIDFLQSPCNFYITKAKNTTISLLNPPEKRKQKSHSGLHEKSHDCCLTEKYSFLICWCFSRSEHWFQLQSTFSTIYVPIN